MIIIDQMIFCQQKITLKASDFIIFQEGLVLVLGIVSFVIYVSELGNEYVEKCVIFVDTPTQQVDLAINIFFLLYYAVRVSLLQKAQHNTWLLKFCYAINCVP